MKVIVFSKDGTGVKIGEDSNDSRWYGTTKVTNFIKNIKVGDSVKISWEKGADNRLSLKFIQKVEGEAAVAGEPTPTPENIPGPGEVNNEAPKTPAPVSQPSYSPYSKPVEVQESIKRQAIGHMTSRTLIALQGHVNPDNVNSMIESIYGKFVQMVG